MEQRQDCLFISLYGLFPISICQLHSWMAKTNIWGWLFGGGECKWKIIFMSNIHFLSPSRMIPRIKKNTSRDPHLSGEMTLYLGFLGVFCKYVAHKFLHCIKINARLYVRTPGKAEKSPAYLWWIETVFLLDSRCGVKVNEFFTSYLLKFLDCIGYQNLTDLNGEK